VIAATERGRIELEGAMGLMGVSERGRALFTHSSRVTVASPDGLVFEHEVDAGDHVMSAAVARDGAIALELWAASGGTRLAVLDSDGRERHRWDVPTPPGMSGEVSGALAWAGADALWYAGATGGAPWVSRIDASTGRLLASVFVDPTLSGSYVEGLDGDVSGARCLLTLDAAERGAWPFACETRGDGLLALRQLVSDPGETNPVRRANGELLTLADDYLVHRRADTPDARRVRLRDGPFEADSPFGRPTHIQELQTDRVLVWRICEPPLLVDVESMPVLGTLPPPASANRFAAGELIDGSGQMIWVFQRDDDDVSLTELVYVDLDLE